MRSTWAIAVSAGIIAAAAPRAVGDMLLLRNGQMVVGVISDESEAAVRIRRGDEHGARDESFDRSAIERVIRGPDESREIDSCSDANALIHWARGYYDAGLEAFAGQCIRHAVDLDAPATRQPMQTSKSAPEHKSVDDYATFWNRTILRFNARKAEPRDAEQQLRLARWAHQAHLADDTAAHLRRAWGLDRHLRGVAELAHESDVRLEAWSQLDLTPAIDMPLFSDSISDEDQRVQASPGKVFWTLPVHYDPKASGTVSRTALRGRNAKAWFYGIRNIAVQEGRLRLASADVEAIYERIDMESVEGNGGGGNRTASYQLKGRNTLGPRRREGDKFVQPPLRNRPESMWNSGYLALVFEVPQASTQLSFEWPDGQEETVDLALLRNASIIRRSDLEGKTVDPTAEQDADFPDSPSTFKWLRSPLLKETLAMVQGDSKAMRALGLMRLARIRREIVQMMSDSDLPNALKEWSRVCDDVVLRTFVGDESRVRRAAWEYFLPVPAWRHERSEMPVRTLERIAGADEATQLDIADLVARGIYRTDGGPWWMYGDRRESRPLDESQQPDANVSCALMLLGPLLQSPSQAVTSSAMQSLLHLPTAFIDWNLIASAGATGQLMALSSITRTKDRAAIDKLLRILLENVRPETASKIAEAATQFHLCVDPRDEKILQQWHSCFADIDKIAYLTAMNGADLTALLHAKPFDDIVDEVLGPDRDDEVCKVFWNLVVRQADVARETRAKLISAEPCFPVEVLRSAHDPCFKSMVQTSRLGTSAQRLAALRNFLFDGFSEEAARALGEMPVALAESMIKQLVADPILAHSDALHATLARVGCSAPPSCKALCMQLLTREAAQIDPQSRWRCYAAVKAGVNLAAMDEARTTAPPATAASIQAWIHTLCHATPQDRQSLALAKNAAQSRRRLAQINFRRGQLVDGRYGGLAVLELRQARGGSDERASQDRKVTWSDPFRVTIALPSLKLQTPDPSDRPTTSKAAADEKPDEALTLGFYRVVWNGRPIGSGIALDSGPLLQGPESYLPIMDTVGESGDQSGRKNDDPAAAIIGPLLLPTRRVLTPPTPGKMTVDIAPVLIDALGRAKLAASIDAKALVPASYPLTLRYAAFAGYGGTGPGRPLPDQPSAGDLFLTNVMVVLESIDQGDE